ncbi:MAG: tRNA (adenosine(37)-N6)-threonylcarbamoyltransferase complex transferase subunit TsaD [Planctomycetota bacterium]|nr:tRNA (adenosine(37)-N6)-threonylcarbamoyltransferase complex transferase subunit TsaD [Planctomycetota bacterium]
MIVLGIETSCDETAASVVRRTADGRLHELSSVIATQEKIHEEWGGVVPEMASRAHAERLLPVIRYALDRASTSLAAIDGIAVAVQPGLIGSLLVGVSAAKAMAWSLGKPIVGVDHLVAHLIAAEIDGEPIDYPAIGLVASGGHSSLIHLDADGSMSLIGATVDDAAGEAFDKGATILGIPYPGGPNLEIAAREGDPKAFAFPVPHIQDGLGFSFSGIKTSLLYAVRGNPVRADHRGASPAVAPEPMTSSRRADLAASYQFAIVHALVRGVRKAVESTGITEVVVGGGVCANGVLRSKLEGLASTHHLSIRMPHPRHCTDNAAMIAAAGIRRFARGESDGLELAARPLSALIRGHRGRPQTK